jgi:hypothetical protein
MVKEFEDPRDQILCLVFDATRVWGEGKDTTLEYGIKVVASVAGYAHRHWIAVRIWGGNLQGDVTVSSCYSTQSPGIETSWPEMLRRLALTAPGGGCSLAESLEQLPPGSSALVVVAAGDGPGRRAIGSAAAKLTRLVVVALEGFGEPESSNDLLDALETARIPAARCRTGELAETLQGRGDRLAPFNNREPRLAMERVKGGWQWIPMSNGRRRTPGNLYKEVPHWIRQKYPSMDFKKADHYILTGKTFHYRVFDGLRVERSYKGSKGLVGRPVPKKPKKFGVFWETFSACPIIWIRSLNY